ncbi:hypothetical protein HBN99_10195 [Pseudomonas oryzihabitans]|uniref:hypothetical protein n=1 Tax=Pseudomonas oryzihabitans TaxID=47885 RepID=UPI0014744D9B|nr:hypothetical protein [Pseudomonas oryzihabitans]NMZ64695.1 hypothetical protein [Pseudomonas oryzihabitans]
MANVPKKDAFKQLSGAYKKHSGDFYERIAELLCLDDHTKEPPNLGDKDVRLEIAGQIIMAHRDSYHRSLTEEAHTAIEWMFEQPSFQSGFKSLGFKLKTEHSDNRVLFIENHLERTFKNLPPGERHIRNPHLLYSRKFSKAFELACGVAEAIYGHMSGIRVLAASEGIQTFNRIDALLQELEQLCEKPWMPENLRTKLVGSLAQEENPRVRYLHQNSRRYVQDFKIVMFPESVRRDNSLPARLFAAELIRLNVDLFSAHYKRAVFHFCGLLDLELDMKTIERIAASEKARVKAVAGTNAKPVC